MAPAVATKVDNCTTVLEYRVNGAVLSTSDVGLNVIVVGDEIVYVPVKELGAEIVEVLIVGTVKVPDMLTESLICIAEESPELISLTSKTFTLNVPDTFNESFNCMAELSALLISFTVMLLDPVMVMVSPLTAVDMLVPPATLNVSPNVTAVPVLSSPTRVIVVSVFCA